MDADDARKFIRENHRAVLATYRQDGSPQLSPVMVDIDPDDTLVISSRETAMKVKNLQRDPRASVCVFTDGFFGQWVSAEGRAVIMHLPEAMEGLVDYYRRLSGEHPDWDDYRAAMEKERRVLIRVSIGRAGPDRSG